MWIVRLALARPYTFIVFSQRSNLRVPAVVAAKTCGLWGRASLQDFRAYLRAFGAKLYRTSSLQFSSTDFTLAVNWSASAPSIRR
jgi:hypothetical protein